MNTRLKYKLKVILTPLCWCRSGIIDPQWDQYLWDSIEDGKIEFVGMFQSLINNCKVWTENYPYASGTTIIDGKMLWCSRATALYLHDQLSEAFIFQKLKGPHDELEIFSKHGIHIKI